VAELVGLSEQLLALVGVGRVVRVRDELVELLVLPGGQRAVAGQRRIDGLARVERRVPPADEVEVRPGRDVAVDQLAGERGERPLVDLTGDVRELVDHARDRPRNLEVLQVAAGRRVELDGDAGVAALLHEALGLLRVVGVGVELVVVAEERLESRLAGLAAGALECVLDDALEVDGVVHRAPELRRGERLDRRLHRVVDDARAADRLHGRVGLLDSRKRRRRDVDDEARLAGDELVDAHARVRRAVDGEVGDVGGLAPVVLVALELD